MHFSALFVDRLAPPGTEQFCQKPSSYCYRNSLQVKMCSSEVKTKWMICFALKWQGGNNNMKTKNKKKGKKQNKTQLKKSPKTP